jgi:hypothetical protein
MTATDFGADAEQHCTMLGVYMISSAPPIVQLFHSGRRSDW